MWLITFWFLNHTPTHTQEWLINLWILNQNSVINFNHTAKSNYSTAYWSRFWCCINQKSHRKLVVYFLNHINQLVGQCDFLNQPSFRSFHSLHSGWFRKSHLPTRWLMWFRKYTTRLTVWFPIISWVSLSFSRTNISEVKYVGTYGHGYLMYIVHDGMNIHFQQSGVWNSLTRGPK